MTPLEIDVINSRSRIMDYVVCFTPTFPLPAGSHIKVVFPAYMSIMTSSYFNTQFQLHYIQYGLEDISEQQKVGIEYTGSIQNSLLITDYKAMTNTNEISIIVKARNVSQSL
jgi:hypothetical protein